MSAIEHRQRVFLPAYEEKSVTLDQLCEFIKVARSIGVRDFDAISISNSGLAVSRDVK